VSARRKVLSHCKLGETKETADTFDSNGLVPADARDMSCVCLNAALPQGILELNAEHERLDRDIWISIRGVERKLLSRRSARGEDAAVLFRTIFNYRNQLHVPPYSLAENHRQVENANT
jgi:hypothetical protein